MNQRIANKIDLTENKNYYFFFHFKMRKKFK